MNAINTVFQTGCHVYTALNQSPLAKVALGAEVGFTLRAYAGSSTLVEKFNSVPKVNLVPRGIQSAYTAGLVFRVLNALNYSSPYRIGIQLSCFGLSHLASIGNVISLDTKKEVDHVLNVSCTTVSVISAVALLTLGEPLFAGTTLAMMSVDIVCHSGLISKKTMKKVNRMALWTFIIPTRIIFGGTLKKIRGISAPCSIIIQRLILNLKSQL